MKCIQSIALEEPFCDNCRLCHGKIFLNIACILHSQCCLFTKYLLFAVACKTQVDLGFLIDGSGSVEMYGKGNFQKCKEFVKSLTRAFVISPTDTRIGVILFSSRSELQFDFTQYKTAQEIEEAIGNIKYPGYTTKTGAGLTMAADKLFNNVRTGVPRVLIVLTDGASNDDVVTPSDALKSTGVIIFTVGLGKNFKKDQLNVMASDPKEEHVFTVDFPQMETIVKAMQETLCKGKSLYLTGGCKKLIISTP